MSRSDDEEMPVSCSVCGEAKGKNQFTKTEWKKPEGEPRMCRACQTPAPEQRTYMKSEEDDTDLEVVAAAAAANGQHDAAAGIFREVRPTHGT